MFLNENILDILFIGHSGCGKSSFLDYVTSTYYYGMSKTEKEDNILIINQMKDTSVQYFRQNMKIFCQSYCTVFNKKKLVIIDDIDNINEHCQQILRSYMDNYSKNVYFIFTCTTANKVIGSIQSRLQIITLPSISKNHIQVITENICNEENIVIVPKAMEILYQLSNLSLRRLYGFLQLFYLCDSTINETNIFTICNCIPFEAIKQYFNHIHKGEMKKAIIQLYRYIDNGYSCIDIYEHILIYLKQNNELCDNFKYFVVQKGQ
jgi:DNA polymerase III delta prime subunit